MSTSPPLHQVGAPDAERETSPVVDQGDEGDELDIEAGAHGGVCRFNGTPFPVGAMVLSGSEVLRCEAPGVWVRTGELRPHGKVLD
ncbi:MAG TPA: hypothetical protein VF453_02930 [Burkholderiaceae bacterium]